MAENDVFEALSEISIELGLNGSFAGDTEPDHDMTL